MPSSIFFNGQRRYRPSVYTRVVNNLGDTSAAATGNIAVVGDFPQLKQSTPVKFTRQSDMVDYFRGTNGELSALADLMFKPLAGEGSPDSITVVSVNETTQASLTNNGLKVSSRLWGADGNRVSVKINANADDADLYDIEIRNGGVDVESVIGLGEGEVASLLYTQAGAGEFFTDMKLSLDGTDMLLVGELLCNNGLVQGGTDLFGGANSFASGAVTLTLSDNQTAESTITLIGLDEAGAAASETITIGAAASAGDEFVSTTVFSSLTDSSSVAGSFVGTLTIAVPVFDKPLADISNLEAELNAIIALNSELTGSFTASLPAIIVKGSDLDNLSSTTCFGASVSMKSDLSSIIEWMSGSSFVEGERLAANTAPSTAATFSRLSGGSKDAAVAASDWTSALDSIKRLDINILVPFTDNQANQQQALTSAVEAAQEAGYERNVWVGTSAAQTIANAFANWSKKFNDRNVAVVAQSIKVGGKTLDPKFTAALLAAMQGATPIAEPLTRKQPTALVTETVQTFDREDEAALAIRRGLVIFADPSNTGLRVERSVTTWMKDDNPIYSEVSANESLNNCVREVRSALQAQIGSRITSAKVSDVRRTAQNTLNGLKKNGLISDFRDLSVSLEGDAANVVFSVAAIEPLNFITVTTNVVR
jgi:nucleotide-binding universal stress UspA family protein